LITAFLKRMGGKAGDGINVDVDADASGNRDKAAAGRWVWPCANTALMAVYVALLEDVFRLGSVLHREGARPLNSLPPCEMLGKGPWA
jgi:hypothetical protein